MNRFAIAALAAPLLVLGACNVTDNNNGSTTISLDENRIEAGTEMLANEATRPAPTPPTRSRMPAPRSKRAPTRSRNAPAASPTASRMSTSTSTSTPATARPATASKACHRRRVV